MKLSLALSALLLSASLVSGQTCNGYFPLEKGTQFDLSHFDAKDKPTAVVSYEVTASGMRDGGQYATVKVVTTPEKGDPTNGEFDAECKGDALHIDVRSMIPNEIMAPYQNMEMTLTGDALQIPNRLSVGQTLPDATATLTIQTGAFPLKMTVSIRDRKVVAEEKVTVAAGTYTCYKIEENDEVKFGATIKYTTTQWICPGVGMVKQTAVRSNGKPMSRSELTKFLKP